MSTLSSLSTLKIKVSSGSSIRRTTVKAPVTFASVVAVLEKLFDLAPGQKFVVKYLDDENELITISTNDDLLEAVQVMNDSGSSSLKLEVIFDKKDFVENPKDAVKVDVIKTALKEDLKHMIKKEKILQKLEALRVDEDDAPKVLKKKLEKEEKLLAKLQKLEDRVTTKATSEDSPPKYTSAAEKIENLLDFDLKVKKVLEEKEAEDREKVQTQLLDDALFGPRVLEDKSELTSGKDGPIVHLGFGCNGCGIKPIVGKRFRCTMCFDYDLCENCESLGIHPADHTLIMHKTAFVYGSPASFAAVAAPAMRFYAVEDRCEKPWKKHLHKHEKADRKFEKVDEPKRKERREPRARRTIGSPFYAKFIRDATLEKGAVVERDALLVKTWAVQNDGDAAWPESVKLQWISGDRTVLFDGQTEFAVPAARPNQVVDVSAVLKAPAERGRYRSGFRLVDHEGRQFGHSLWIDIIVV